MVAQGSSESVLWVQILDEFQAAFVAVVFSNDLVLRQQSVVPFMFLLPRSMTRKNKEKGLLLERHAHVYYSMFPLLSVPSFGLHFFCLYSYLC